MIKVKKQFYGVDGTDDVSIQVCATDRDTVYLKINNNEAPEQYIYLDIDTAIYFSKDLRRAISIVKEVR